MTTDSYGNLTSEGVAAYLKEKEIFPADAHLTVEDLHAVKESIEGFVNLIFHVYDDNGKSVILKQMLEFPRYRIEDEKNDTVEAEDAGEDGGWTLDLGRMRSEIAVLIFWNTVCPGICPEMYLFDEANRIIVMEDLMALSLLRFDLCRMVKHPMFPERIGTFFARNLFFSSNLHLTRYKKSEVERFFVNPEYNALCSSIFEDNIAVSMKREMASGTEAKRKELVDNPKISAEVKRLRENFMENKECLIHTDLHSSNIMINQEDVRIIDGEFGGFGPLAQDFGRLTASLSLNYISWFGDDEKSAPEKADYQVYLCETIESLYHVFQQEFRNLVATYQEESYSLKILDVDFYLIKQLQDALSYAGANITSRLANRGICYDISRLPKENRTLPSILGMTVAEELLLNHENYTAIEEYTRFLKTLTK
ncbi:phosphotransferase [Acetobacterium paludosum]|uniref:Phosphotransferase n=1 Tax=Acetobacterium paludosum TaxID=52693 RepID=A0A923HVQ7_9FIRM|nr:phosphotransferase [Acetobacterium paludosum]MBC3889156.1 phosphotransferase [Acetobacterium paludosum]